MSKMETLRKSQHKPDPERYGRTFQREQQQGIQGAVSEG